MTATLTVPDRSLAQRLGALKEANRIRMKRAVLKREVKAGARRWDTLLVHQDCKTMRLHELLMCVPHVGRVKADRIVLKAQVSPSKRLERLTDRQRQVLLELVPTWGGVF